MQFLNSATSFRWMLGLPHNRPRCLTLCRPTALLEFEKTAIGEPSGCILALKDIEDETSELVRQCFFWELLTGIGVG
jgi:hypothetical protein